MRINVTYILTVLTYFIKPSNPKATNIVYIVLGLAACLWVFIYYQSSEITFIYKFNYMHSQQGYYRKMTLR